jgi:hypothetical protein
MLTTGKGSSGLDFQSVRGCEPVGVLWFRIRVRYIHTKSMLRRHVQTRSRAGTVIAKCIEYISAQKARTDMVGVPSSPP